MIALAKSLLIVDDEPAIRTSMSLLLREFGFHVRTSSDGVAALTAIENQLLDIILSDLNMPGMSGFEFLSIVHASYRSIRVIAMSGAFHGDEVPSGVPADAFYPKGSGIACLLGMLGVSPARNIAGRSESSSAVHIRNQADA